MRNKKVVIRNHKGEDVGTAREKTDGEYVLPLNCERNLIEEYYYEVDGKNSKDVPNGKVRVQWARLKGTATYLQDSSNKLVTITAVLDPAVPAPRREDLELYQKGDFDLDVDFAWSDPNRGSYRALVGFRPVGSWLGGLNSVEVKPSASEWGSNYKWIYREQSRTTERKLFDIVPDVPFEYSFDLHP